MTKTPFGGLRNVSWDRTRSFPNTHGVFTIAPGSWKLSSPDVRKHQRCNSLVVMSSIYQLSCSGGIGEPFLPGTRVLNNPTAAVNIAGNECHPDPLILGHGLQMAYECVPFPLQVSLSDSINRGQSVRDTL